MTFFIIYCAFCYSIAMFAIYIDREFRLTEMNETQSLIFFIFSPVVVTIYFLQLIFNKNET